ncbi:maltase A3-like isoform X2 [Homarus americanus]|nr:maltase A3-like isoform X2 [Homarus americanus]
MPPIDLFSGLSLLLCCDSFNANNDTATTTLPITTPTTTPATTPTTTPAPLLPMALRTEAHHEDVTHSEPVNDEVDDDDEVEYVNTVVVKLPSKMAGGGVGHLVQINVFIGGLKEALQGGNLPQDIQLIMDILNSSCNQEHLQGIQEDPQQDTNSDDLHNTTISLSTSEGGNGECNPSVEKEKGAGKEEMMKGAEEEEDKKLAWWQRNIVYQVYPRSFQDTDGSGKGDLKGIAMRADYLQQLGVATVWLSPIFTSPMADFGYDISNFTDIDPILGDMQDFDFLLQEFHARDLKVVLDLVPNHTSDQHEWFTKSVLREDSYTDYYVWADPKGYTPSGTPIPPNNWLSVLRGTAWQWVEERQQFYLHKYRKEQPDLNYRNPAVRSHMKEVLKFWLDRGVDGFCLDALKHLYEAEDLYQDEPVSLKSGVSDPLQYEYLEHTLTVNQPEVFQIALREWRDLIDQYPDRFLIAQLYDPDISEIMKYYGTSSAPLSHFPFNFRFIQYLKTRDDVTGHNLLAYITEWLDNMPAGMWPNWVLSNHGNSRLASRVGGDLVDALHMMTMLLPGTPITYYGDELGMEDTYVTWEETQDPYGKNFGPTRYQEASRDPSRSPMQWDDSHNAGFSSANNTWLPVNDNYLTVNVKAQMAAQESHLRLYQRLAKLRQEVTFTHGNLTFPVVTQQVFSFLRSHLRSHSYLVVINTSRQQLLVDLTKGTGLPPTATVLLRSVTHTTPRRVIHTTPG